jgi:hypothetical protein
MSCQRPPNLQRSDGKLGLAAAAARLPVAAAPAPPNEGKPLVESAPGRRRWPRCPALAPGRALAMACASATMPVTWRPAQPAVDDDPQVRTAVTPTSRPGTRQRRGRKSAAATVHRHACAAAGRSTASRPCCCRWSTANGCVPGRRQASTAAYRRPVGQESRQFALQRTDDRRAAAGQTQAPPGPSASVAGPPSVSTAMSRAVMTTR